jgi:hypothetical protein
MPEINQYTVKTKELTEILIKHLGVQEGKWTLMVTFTFTAINAGPEGGEILPSAILGMQKVGIQRADANTPPDLIVDAASVAG